MRKETRATNDSEFRRGKRDLARHRPDLAMMHFRAVVESTPVEDTRAFVEAMYWLAVSFFRLDKPELAIKTLASAQRIRRRGVVRDAYLAWVNGYGMIRRGKSELDDFYAYSSLQIGSYLGKKRMKRFDSMEEKDIVMRIVTDAWKRLCASGMLEGKSCSEKLGLFKSRKPIFPSFRQGARGSGARMLAGEFGTAACLENEARCVCGSGLPYCMCCGRIPGLRELSGG